MKRILIFVLILSLFFCVGCDEKKQSKPTESESIGDFIQLPNGLAGEWVSATVSDRGYSERITFEEDGTLTVAQMKDGFVEQTIFGTFRVLGDKITFEISGGASPYTDEFRYTLSGRELFLIDDDGPAHYLRTS